MGNLQFLAEQIVDDVVVGDVELGRVGPHLPIVRPERQVVELVRQNEEDVGRRQRIAFISNCFGELFDIFFYYYWIRHFIYF